MDDTVRWTVDWSNLYGQLPAGRYRLSKQITDLRAPGDYDQSLYWAYFEIEN